MQPALAPAGGDVCDFTYGQINGLFNNTLANVLAHQMKNPNGPMGRLMRERGRRVRIFDPEAERAPLLPPDPRGVPMRLSDLDPAQVQLLQQTFQCYSNIMLARNDQDKQSAWTARADLLALRKQVNGQIMRGQFPRCVDTFLDVAEALVTRDDMVTWQALLNQMQQRGGPPPRGGA